MEPVFPIRRMEESDLRSVMEIQRRAFVAPWSEELFRKELAHEWSTIYLAEDSGNGELCGILIFWKVHDEMHILNIATATAYRRRGVARALLEQGLTEARRARCTLATLEVRKGNEEAIALYKAFGFRQVGVRPNYYVDERADAIVMILNL